jgi:tRNA(adenine34) deaminase
MKLALAEARRAGDADEVPVGCVIVHMPTGQVLGAGHNLRIRENDPSAHAEIVAMREAGERLGNWRLDDCAIVVTLEPCPMCAGAIVNARLPVLIYGCPDPKAGAVRTLYQICDDPRLNHRVQIYPGVLADECSAILKDFFRARRGKKEEPQVKPDGVG